MGADWSPWPSSPADVQGLGAARCDRTIASWRAGDLVERMLRASGRRIDMGTSFVDAMLSDGSQLHVVIPVSTRSARRTGAP